MSNRDHDTRAISRDEINKLIARSQSQAAHDTHDDDAPLNTRDVIFRVYNALLEKGYEPVRQLTGYILTGEPTYITGHRGARNIIGRVDREDILEELLGFYLFEPEE